ncbi:unnamed protein product, partial [Discosporangium mesarthrocarpum]
MGKGGHNDAVYRRSVEVLFGSNGTDVTGVGGGGGGSGEEGGGGVQPGIDGVGGKAPIGTVPVMAVPLGSAVSHRSSRSAGSGLGGPAAALGAEKFTRDGHQGGPQGEG